MNVIIRIEISRKEFPTMLTRKEVLDYGITLPDVYVDTPFRDTNWVLLRCRGNRKAFAWTFEREGKIWVNVKVAPEWRDFWRNAYQSVIQIGRAHV